ncbi:MAG: hypothetical protein LC798_13100 [Chloroflexi bacterium]|nr:hypothetical protein [Chloroflexota bacterium]
MAESKDKTEQKPTAYVVLERFDGATAAPEGEQSYPLGIVWRPVIEGGKIKRFVATHGEKAVEQHTGKGKDAKVGIWKAVAFSNWKGTTTVDPPEQVYADRRKTTDEE